MFDSLELVLVEQFFQTLCWVYFCILVFFHQNKKQLCFHNFGVNKVIHWNSSDIHLWTLSVLPSTYFGKKLVSPGNKFPHSSISTDENGFG